MSQFSSFSSTDIANLSNTNQSLSQMNLVSVETTSTRPTSLVLVRDDESFCRKSLIDLLPLKPSTTIDNIHITPSPLDNRPRYFRPGSIIDDTTYHRITNSTMDNNFLNIEMEEENLTNDNQSSSVSSIIHMEKPMNDPIADALVECLDQIDEVHDGIDDNVTENESECDSIIITSSHPYPPINRTGQVADHDRPFADYGHLGRYTYFSIGDKDHSELFLLL